MTCKKKLIKVALPLEAINKDGCEGEIHTTRHPTVVWMGKISFNKTDN